MTHPATPWEYECDEPGCSFKLTVFARGGRGRDQGSGYEAAVRMDEHKRVAHPAREWVKEDPA